MIEVLKNLAILGALINFAADGAGAYALDNMLAARAGRMGTAEMNKVVREAKHA